MFVERIVLTDFRCFGPQPQTIALANGLTAFVGSNGTGKTAVMDALQRLFGVTSDQRRPRRQDFHVPMVEPIAPKERSFSIEAILGFPELEAEGEVPKPAVADFFQQMAADENGVLRCRLRLDATWTDDGSSEGEIETKYRAVRTFAPTFKDDECTALSPYDRGRIQLIYIPATRDAVSQVTMFLRSRLWRAVLWSSGISDALKSSGAAINSAFSAEAGVGSVTEALKKRWQEVHHGGVDAEPIFRPIDLRLHEFVRKVEVVFRPDEAHRDRNLEDLSDGQRSLFHIAMTAAALDVESTLAAQGNAAFDTSKITVPSLTILALEEPENNLAPYYLAGIIRQIRDLTANGKAQAVLSSHSPSILARVEPRDVRHFHLEPTSRTTKVREIRVPTDPEEASRFVREAVRTYPELYFARLVILGEGASEEVVVPRLADALGLEVDRSFVAIVPLGGRHVNHLWKLLQDLEIPHATLLDLDYGRADGGWGRIKTACEQLIENGTKPESLFQKDALVKGYEAALDAMANWSPTPYKGLEAWVAALRTHGVFFCTPLDLDGTMFKAYRAAYMALESGMRGPSEAEGAKNAVLGTDGSPALYTAESEETFRWYRYLFLGRGKPTTHMRVLSKLSDKEVAAAVPDDLRALLAYVADRLKLLPPAGTRA